MASHKILKSIAHNTGHPFTSLMNYQENDYVMGHLLVVARKTRKQTFQFNLLNGEVTPKDFLISPIQKSTSWYASNFQDFLKRSESDSRFVISAMLEIKFDLSSSRPYPHDPNILENQFFCDVTIIDDKQKVYTAHFEGWWYPEI